MVENNFNSDIMNAKAYLEVIIGPMFSGKTSLLLQIYKNYKFCSIPIAVINHSADKRYSETMLSSHDKCMIPCIQTEKISDIWFYHNLDDAIDSVRSINHMNLRGADVILINEAQFFEDLYSCVVDMLKENKRVYVCGLDGDFERKKFGQMLDIIPLCDKVSKLTALCTLCKNGEKGIFSMRLGNDKSQVLIGSDSYIPVCRTCYNKNVNV